MKDLVGHPDYIESLETLKAAKGRLEGTFSKIKLAKTEIDNKTE